MKTKIDTLSESALHRRAKATGFALRKSRTRRPHSGDHGLFALYDGHTGNVVLGLRFDASAEDYKTS